MYILCNSVMWHDPANHRAHATFSCCHYDESHTKSSSHPIQTHLLINRTKSQLKAESGNFWRSVSDLAVLPNARWLSLHMPGLCVSTWTTQMSPSTCSLKWSSAHVTPCFDELIWDVVCTRLSVAQCECCNHEAMKTQLHSRFREGVWLVLSTIVSSELKWLYYVRRKTFLDHDRHEKY